MPEHDPVYKVTIIPRGRALGLTWYLPEGDRYSTSKRRLESHIASLFGGRVAEELIFGADGVTTGASNDIERATDLARNMVTKWGLSDQARPAHLLGRERRSVPRPPGHAAQAGVRRDRACHRRGNPPRHRHRTTSAPRQILETNLDKLHAMAEALVKYETIDEQQIKDIMNGKAPKPPADWDDSVGTPQPKRPEGEAEGGGGPSATPAGQH